MAVTDLDLGRYKLGWNDDDAYVLLDAESWGGPSDGETATLRLEVDDADHLLGRAS